MPRQQKHQSAMQLPRSDLTILQENDKKSWIPRCEKLSESILSLGFRSVVDVRGCGLQSVNLTGYLVWTMHQGYRDPSPSPSVEALDKGVSFQLEAAMT